MAKCHGHSSDITITAYRLILDKQLMRGCALSLQSLAEAFRDPVTTKNSSAPAVFLALAAILVSPGAAEIFGSFNSSGLTGILEAVKQQVVSLLVAVLDPSLKASLPPALISTFKDEKMAKSIVVMMDHMMADPEFVEVLKNFINTSMTNEALLGSLKKVMQEALADSHLYKSAMHGVASSLNPLHSDTLTAMKNTLLGRSEKEVEEEEKHESL
ncbi:fabB [Symbiodinium natans]|uniref:FabB protein n=1 Tax=Symbiodinium natans TaxID=878477 RepID=A0A812QJ91_9DINO|nr:fabB [Symbiodinium natans]